MYSMSTGIKEREEIVGQRLLPVSSVHHRGSRKVFSLMLTSFPLSFTGVINSWGYAVSSTQRFQDNQLIGHIEKSVSSNLSLEKALSYSLSLSLVTTVSFSQN